MSNYIIDLELELQAINHHKAGNYSGQVSALMSALQSINLHAVSREYPYEPAIYVSDVEIGEDAVTNNDSRIKSVIAVKQSYGYHVFQYDSGALISIGDTDGLSGVLAIVTSTITFIA